MYCTFSNIWTPPTIGTLTLFTPMSHFYTPLKTSENQRFSDVFRGCINGTLAWKGLIHPAIMVSALLCLVIKLSHWLLRLPFFDKTFSLHHVTPALKFHQRFDRIWIHESCFQNMVLNFSIWHNLKAVFTV